VGGGILRRRLLLISALGLFAAATLTVAQVPDVQDINFYGLRRVSAESVLRAAKLHSGEPLPRSKGDMEDAIEQVPGILRTRVEAICCEGKNAVVFVGIEEREGPHVGFRQPPSGTAPPPIGMMEAYQQFLAALRHSGQQPHAEGRDPALTDAEEKFTAFAKGDLPVLREALRNGAEAEERAAAAIVIGYAPKKFEIMPDLQYALRDPDESVRSNAIRSMHASVVSVGNPAQGLPVPLGTLVDLLQSLVLSDRLEAADLLVSLTDGGDQGPLTIMRARALPALVEMARWESLRYAIRPYILVGRIAGFSEKEIIQHWSDGEREQVIQKALALPKTPVPAGTSLSRKPAPK
jgi:hypothetical protein